MKTGKTHAMADMIRRQPAGSKTVVVISTVTLCKSTATRLSVKSGKTVVDYQDTKGISSADAIVTTFNSLHKVVETLEHSNIHALVFDESEQGAGFLAHGTITNKSQAGRAIRQLSERASKVLFMDAHLGANSSLFAQTFMPACNFSLLHNKYTPWRDWTYSEYAGKAAGISLIADRLKDGERIWITSSSKVFLRNLHSALEKTGHLKGLNVLAAYPSSTRADSPEFVAAKENNELFKEYDVVFSSPAGGVGLSVEGEHFHRTIAFNVRDDRTPDATSTMQFPFRVRDAIKKHIDVVMVDNIGDREINTDHISQDAELLHQLHCNITAMVTDKEIQRVLLNDIAKTHGFYEAKIAIERAREMSSYAEIIRAEFKAKGIERVEPAALPENADIEDAIKEAREEFKEERILAIVGAPIIDSDTAATIRGLERAGKAVTVEQKQSLKKFTLLERFHASDSEPTSDDMRAYIALQDKGIHNGMDRIVIGSLPSPTARRVATAFTVGVGEDELYIRDAAAMPAAVLTAQWAVSKTLCKVAGIKRHDDTYSLNAGAEITGRWLKSKDSSNSGTSVVAELMKAVDHYNATKPAKRISKKQLRAYPQKVVRALLEDFLKISTTAVYGQDAFTIDAEQPAIEKLNSRLARGSFGLLKMLDRMDALDLLASGDVSAAVSETLQLNRDNREFLADKLQQLSKRMQNSAILEYLRIAQKPFDGGKLRPLALANAYLRELVERRAGPNFGHFRQ